MPFEYDSFGMIGQDIRGITLSFWCQRSSVFYSAFCITRMKISPSQRGVPVDCLTQNCRYEHQRKSRPYTPMHLADSLQAKNWIDEWEEAGKVPRRAGLVTVYVDLGNSVF
jgi:hypothetical protein